MGWTTEKSKLDSRQQQELFLFFNPPWRPDLIFNGYRGPFLEGKRPGAWNWPLNFISWRCYKCVCYTSISPYAYMAWNLVQNRDNVTILHSLLRNGFAQAKKEDETKFVPILIFMTFHSDVCHQCLVINRYSHITADALFHRPQLEYFEVMLEVEAIAV
jgi:hypothetical protein